MERLSGASLIAVEWDLFQPQAERWSELDSRAPSSAAKGSSLSALSAHRWSSCWWNFACLWCPQSRWPPKHTQRECTKDWRQNIRHVSVSIALQTESKTTYQQCDGRHDTKSIDLPEALLLCCRTRKTSSKSSKNIFRLIRSLLRTSQNENVCESVMANTDQEEMLVSDLRCSLEWFLL